MQSHLIFITFLTMLALQRLMETVRSSRNSRILFDRGGFEVAGEHFPVMVAVHFCWLVSTVVEYFFFPIKVNPWIAGLAIFFFFLGQILRIAAIETLGSRWTVKVYVVPGEHLVRRGIYRWVRHPNYLGVKLEMFFMPLIFGCVRTSIIFGILNILLLRFRISKEEAALDKYSLKGHL